MWYFLFPDLPAECFLRLSCRTVYHNSLLDSDGFKYLRTTASYWQCWASAPTHHCCISVIYLNPTNQWLQGVRARRTSLSFLLRTISVINTSEFSNGICNISQIRFLCLCCTIPPPKIHLWFIMICWRNATMFLVVSVSKSGGGFHETLRIYLLDEQYHWVINFWSNWRWLPQLVNKVMNKYVWISKLHRGCIKIWFGGD